MTLAAGGIVPGNPDGSPIFPPTPDGCELLVPLGSPNDAILRDLFGE